MHYVSNMQQVLDIALLDTKVMHPIDLNAALKEVAKEN
jgi:hypothetical protein